MSSIIFNRLVNGAPANEDCDAEQEVEDENYNFNEVDATSKNYLVHLYKNFKTCHNWLLSLIAAKKLDYIIINLLKNHQYSFSVKKFNDNTIQELTDFEGEDHAILKYLDDEELPPILTDAIEKYSLSNIFHNGCIISEIRDYRQSIAAPNLFNSSFVLLKTTCLSLYHDVKRIQKVNSPDFSWDTSSRFRLESKLIYLTSPKLCLDPNPCIGLLSKKLSGRKKLIFCNKNFSSLQKRTYKKEVNINEHRKEFRLLKFLKSKKALPTLKSASVESPQIECDLIDLFKDLQLLLHDSNYDSKNESTDNFEKLEIYTVEYIDDTAVRLIIFHRALNDAYYCSFVGNKSQDFHDYQGLPQFKLGDNESKVNFVNQFCEHATTHSRKPTKLAIQMEEGPHKTQFLHSKATTHQQSQPEATICTKLASA